MKIINFGSLNVDNVYQVPSIVRPGETIAAKSLMINPGGKGANQSVALARAGAHVWQAGMVGQDSEWLKDSLAKQGVDVRHVIISPNSHGGHAIIQVDDDGQNSIVIYGGANQEIPTSHIGVVLADAHPGDWLTLQNEINLTPELMKAGKAAGMNICFNPAPMTDSVRDYPLDCVDLFIVNEIEAAELAARSTTVDMEDIIRELAELFSDSMICVTLGEDGALFWSAATDLLRQPAFATRVVDTTAAGDTFVGYFLHEISRGTPPAEAMAFACKAAAITVSRPGASQSIPTRDEVK
ncbi:MAG TPA: ribokinase [Lentisphaeria bacterium]|nr:ribokinase [Lentisphaeria bacterium]